MKQLMFYANTETMLYEFPLGYRSPFQWIPSDFEIRDDGSVRIASCINNLHPVQHADIRFVPRFERTLASLKIPFPTGEFIVPDYHLLGKQRPVVWDSLRLRHAPHVSLRGKTVQVVVKMAEILGSRHIEGTSAERIVATGIYYFDNDNITSSRFSFRVNVKQPSYDQ
uniref:DUF4246 domain-containing protein n=1 Tax=Globisporangium ultimum (strain ATCC 200006 / CBS 805.95 / DAOM BR144) TaxID=431595 RepID=K3X3G0_GLOUD